LTTHEKRDSGACTSLSPTGLRAGKAPTLWSLNPSSNIILKSLDGPRSWLLRKTSGAPGAILFRPVGFSNTHRDHVLRFHHIDPSYVCLSASCSVRN
jgi:hypothetical protein